MSVGRMVSVEMNEYKELMMLKGRIVSLEEYVKNASFVDKEVVLGILGIVKKEEKECLNK